MALLESAIGRVIRIDTDKLELTILIDDNPYDLREETYPYERSALEGYVLITTLGYLVHCEIEDGIVVFMEYLDGLGANFYSWMFGDGPVKIWRIPIELLSYVKPQRER